MMRTRRRPAIAIAGVYPGLSAAVGIPAMTIALLLSFAAAAEPITLKLSFFSSDRSLLYLVGPKPFVDAVNAEGRGRVRIEPYFSNRLGGPEHLSQLIRDGTVDIGFEVPSYERAVFPDVGIIELPGLYRDAAEATQVFSQLVEAGALRGFSDFYVIGAFAGEPESIHARPPVVSLADLKGKRIRVNNEIEAEDTREARRPFVNSADRPDDRGDQQRATRRRFVAAGSDDGLRHRPGGAIPLFFADVVHTADGADEPRRNSTACPATCRRSSANTAASGS